MKAKSSPNGLIELSGPFSPYGGHCWVTPTDAEIFPDCDDETDPERSYLILREDNRDLGPPHRAHADIARTGNGAYSHWHHLLYFSTSDNTDPNSNGRKYTARSDENAYFWHHANYSTSIVRKWADHLPSGFSDVIDKTVLEIGPGRDMGTVLALACLGAREVWAVDRFAAGWQEGWHGSFLERLALALLTLDTAVDLTVLEHASQHKSINIGPIHHYRQPLEQMGEDLHQRIDLSFSNSTFEHFYSFKEAAQQLHRASVPNGRGIHHVDFRDHAFFDRPLDFLLMPSDRYADPVVNSDYRRGNRIRPGEMERMLRGAGFDEVCFIPSSRTDADYLTDFLPLLRTCKDSDYQDIDIVELEYLSGWFILGT